MSGGRKQNRILPALIIGIGAYNLLQHTGPIIVGVEVNGLSVLVAGFLLTSGAALLSDGFWYLGNVFERVSARTAMGLKGTASWVKSLHEIRDDLMLEGWGPYWGTFRGKEVMADFASNALTVGTAGSGKWVGVVQPTILSIHESKTIIDFKSELSCCLARVLRERGEIVHNLNIGDVNTDLLGPSAEYNPLCIIADDFWRSGGLMDVSDDIHELCLQLYSEPAGSGGGSDDNLYFRDGARDLIGFAVQMCVLVDGYGATLSDVAAMLNDRESLLRHAKWACGRLEQSIEGERV